MTDMTKAEIIRKLSNAHETLDGLKADTSMLLLAADAYDGRADVVLDLIAECMDALREYDGCKRIAKLEAALKKIGGSGPVDSKGNDDPDAGWSWCYDVANAALKGD